MAEASHGRTGRTAAEWQREGLRRDPELSSAGLLNVLRADRVDSSKVERIRLACHRGTDQLLYSPITVRVCVVIPPKSLMNLCHVLQCFHSCHFYPTGSDFRGRSCSTHSRR